MVQYFLLAPALQMTVTRCALISTPVTSEGVNTLLPARFPGGCCILEDWWFSPACPTSKEDLEDRLLDTYTHSSHLSSKCSMDQVVGYINRRYNLTDSHVFHGDPRVLTWPLMGNLEGVLVLTTLYLLAVKYGTAYMASRPPFQIMGLLVIYNFFMVGLSLYMLFEMMACIYHKSFGLLCQPVDYSPSPMGHREASVAWWYFFSKIIEFLDTAFFVLRKKNGQITFLHVYHHSTMAVICWYVAKYVPGGEKFYTGSLNLLVHVVMYSYYGLAAMGPHMHKYLWWKRYLTKFQMIQFLTVNARSMLSLMEECLYPRWINIFSAVYSTSLLLLFANFYHKAYSTQGTKKLLSASHAASSLKCSKPAANGRPHED